MQLTKTLFQNSAIFIEKKWVENRLWGKSGFLWGKKNSFPAGPRSKLLAAMENALIVQLHQIPCAYQASNVRAK